MSQQMELCVFQCVASSAHFFIFIFRKDKTMKKRLKRIISVLISVIMIAGADANGGGATSGQYVVRLKNYLTNSDYETNTSTIVLGSQI